MTTKLNQNQLNDYSFDNSLSRQAIINGTCKVGQRVTANLSTSVVYGGVDRIYGIAGGTVGAGTIAQISNSTIGTSGFALKLAGVTLTGAGLAKIGYRMESKDAVSFKNQKASFSIQVLHDVGSAKTYTIYVNKANSADNFSAVTAISNNGGTSVNSATGTLLKYQNISLGDCSNGIEIIVECNCGAVTTKNFEFTELELCAGDVALPFMPKSFDDELRACQRYYEKSTDYTVFPTNASTYRWYGAMHPPGSNLGFYEQFKVNKRNSSYTVTFYGTNPSGGKWEYFNGGSWVDATTTGVSGSNFSIGNFSVDMDVGADSNSNRLVRGAWAVNNELY